MGEQGGLFADAVTMSATISDCGRYRYHLARRWVQRSARVVAAWGAHPAAGDAPKPAAPMWCLGVTQSGAPRHPLYVRAGTGLVPYRPPA